MSDLDPRGLEAAIDEITGWTTDCGTEPRAWETLQHHDARDIASAAVTAYLDVAHPVVETVEELEALPVGAVVLDSHQEGLVNLPEGWYGIAHNEMALPPEDIAFPARVIWRPHESA